MTENFEIYRQCIASQLEEVNMLSSIYMGPGEMEIIDPSVISDYSEFLQQQSQLENLTQMLKSHIDINICLKFNQNAWNIRLSLPHLYPHLEIPIITVHSTALSKANELKLQNEIGTYIDALEKDGPYLYQILSWLQDYIQDNLFSHTINNEINEDKTEDELFDDFERLWIYSHHIKAKSKRQEILKQAKNFQLSGFSRPGKPGIICVEGLKYNTQKFWRIIKNIHWQKITICKSEMESLSKQPSNSHNKFSRFDGFKELLFYSNSKNDNTDAINDAKLMDMNSFIKFLEDHNSGYMKKELFGFT